MKTLEEVQSVVNEWAARNGTRAKAYHPIDYETGKTKYEAIAVAIGHGMLFQTVQQSSTRREPFWSKDELLRQMDDALARIGREAQFRPRKPEPIK